MSNTRSALVFPGQGAQVVGMGRDLADAFPEARARFDQANDILGFDLATLCFEGPQEELNRTDISQPAILTMSIAGLDAWKTRTDVDALDVVATGGLSLGEYTAHVFAGTMTFEDALRTVQKRGQFMQEACDANPSSMTTILGLDREKVAEAVAAGESVGVVNIANLNCPGQIVISGETAALEAAGEKAKELGARRVIPLAVAGAYHSALMQSAQDKLTEVLAEVTLSAPRIPVAANISGKLIRDPNEIRRSLAEQVTGSVRWEDCVRTMIADGIGTYYEIGPGSVLAGLLKKIDREQTSHTINSVESLEALTGEGAES
jgi:[acyl-carrier-protein] S-malonyltransferase